MNTLIEIFLYMEDTYDAVKTGGMCHTPPWEQCLVKDMLRRVTENFRIDGPAPTVNKGDTETS